MDQPSGKKITPLIYKNKYKIFYVTCDFLKIMLRKVRI